MKGHEARRPCPAAGKAVNTTGERLLERGDADRPPACFTRPTFGPAALAARLRP